MRNAAFYRFELIYNGEVKDKFNLVIPPYTVDYDGKYRDNFQKTFGGTHVDITGMDNTVIKLTGTVAGKRERNGWGNKSSEQFVNVEALRYFRDNIWKYPENKKYKSYWRDMYIKYYDVDLEDAWIIHINNVQIKKDKSQPFWYNYSIQMTTLERAEFKETPGGRLSEALNKFKNTLQGVSDTYAEYTNKVLAYKEDLLTYADTALGFADTVVEFTEELVDQTTSIGEEILTTPEALFSRFNETATRMTDLAESVDDFIQNVIYFAGLEYGEYLKHIMEETSDGLKRMANQYKAIGQRRKNQAAQQGQIVTQLSSAELSIEAGTGNVLSAGIIDNLEKVTVKTTQTLEEIAEDLYSDGKMANVLAEINNLDSVFVAQGTVLLCPIYRDQTTIVGNEVIDPTGEDLGKDLKTVNKQLVANSGGDLLITKEIDNVQQASQNIFKIKSGTLPSDKNFGFDAESLVATPGTTNSDKLAGIKAKESLLKDPRIGGVSDFRYKIEGDIRRIRAKVTLSNEIDSFIFKA